MPVLTQVYEQAAANDLLAGSLMAAKLGVFTNSIVPTNLTLLADLTVPTLAGMVPLAAVFTGVYINSAGNVAFAITSHLFQPTAAVVAPFNVFGWFLEDTGGSFLLMAELLDTPVLISSLADGVLIGGEVTPFNQPG